MLKIISRLFLGLVVCTGSVCVTPTHTSSANAPEPRVVIRAIQATSTTFGAIDEYVVIHNNTPLEVDITNWCISNLYRVTFACLRQPIGVTNERYILPPYADAIFASESHVTRNNYNPADYTYIFKEANQVNGSISHAADELSLKSNTGTVVDAKAWSKMIRTGEMLARGMASQNPRTYTDTYTDADWIGQLQSTPPVSEVETRIIGDDPGNNDDDIPEDDTGTGLDLDPPITIPPVVPLVPLQISELLPNPEGSDTGNEFIELYNPNQFDAVSLDSYSFTIEGSSKKTHKLPAGIVIPPQSYAAITNNDISFALLNTTATIQLYNKGIAVGEPVVYASPKDGHSWTNIEGVWQYTSAPTPGEANSVPVDESFTEEEADSTTESSTSASEEKKPCAANQYRNPDTGRCKLIATATKAPAPCKSTQERNPETGRCRNITSSTTSDPKACKKGQERNPETNRCRNIVEMTKAGFGVKGVQTTAGATLSWYYWAAIAAVVLLVLGYAVWEWRQELLALWTRLRMKLAQRRD